MPFPNPPSVPNTTAKRQVTKRTTPFIGRFHGRFWGKHAEATSHTETYKPGCDANHLPKLEGNCGPNTCGKHSKSVPNTCLKHLRFYPGGPSFTLGKPVASTVRCKWKASNGSAEYDKVRFASVDYNTDWVVFELAPKK